MADVSRGTIVRTPLIVALELAVAEALQTRRRRALGRAEQRAKMRVVDGGRRRDAA